MSAAQGDLVGRAEPVSFDEIEVFKIAMGFSDADLAEAIGVTPRAIRYWRRGDRAIPPWVGVVIRLVSELRRSQGLEQHTMESFSEELRRAVHPHRRPWYLRRSPSTARDSS